MIRRRWVVIPGSMVVVAVSMLLVASRVRSRDQAVADARPPERTVLTEAVERRVLEDELVVRGTVGAAHEVVVGASPPSGRDPVVSASSPAVGTEVAEGSSVVEVAGRPVLVLVGAVPGYRDLRPGDHGPDVAQLEGALARLGFAVGRRDGSYDGALAAAVGAAWHASGYEALEHEPGAVAAARLRLDEAEARWARATAPEEIAAVEIEVATASRLLAEARDRSGPMVPKGEIAFVPALPARVLRAAPPVGSTVTEGPVAVLAAGPLRIRASVDEGSAHALVRGAAVEVAVEASGDRFDGSVVAVGAAALDQETGRRHVALEVEVAGLPAVLLGSLVRVTTSDLSGEGPALVVPLAAVYATPGGDDVVLVVEGEDQEREVEVVAGTSSDGFVVVEPTEPGVLDAGDRVVVGR